MSFLETKITVKDHAIQVPHSPHEGCGKLFFISWSIVVEHKQKISVVKTSLEQILQFTCLTIWCRCTNIFNFLHGVKFTKTMNKKRFPFQHHLRNGKHTQCIFLYARNQCCDKHRLLLGLGNQQNINQKRDIKKLDYDNCWVCFNRYAN